MLIDWLRYPNTGTVHAFVEDAPISLCERILRDACEETDHSHVWRCRICMNRWRPR